MRLRNNAHARPWAQTRASDIFEVTRTMIDPYTPVLAFTLGFLAGYVLQPATRCSANRMVRRLYQRLQDGQR